MSCCWLQVWVGCISRGPSNSVLLGTYEHADTFAYQDEIGQVLLTVCKVDRQTDRQTEYVGLLPATVIGRTIPLKTHYLDVL